jgi:orotate phosphoribosyltransferase
MSAFSVRKEQKSHGLGGRVVGPVTPEDRIAVVEDTTTTGGAMTEAIDVLAETGFRVDQVVALVDRSGGKVATMLQERGIPYTALVVPGDLGVGS